MTCDEAKKALIAVESEIARLDRKHREVTERLECLNALGESLLLRIVELERPRP